MTEEQYQLSKKKLLLAQNVIEKYEKLDKEICNLLSEESFVCNLTAVKITDNKKPNPSLHALFLDDEDFLYLKPSLLQLYQDKIETLKKEQAQLYCGDIQIAQEDTCS